MATSVTEIGSIFPPSEIPFSKSFSHIKTSQSQSWVRNLRSYDYKAIDLHFSSIDYKIKFHPILII